jgi:hypothetical protein
VKLPGLDRRPDCFVFLAAVSVQLDRLATLTALWLTVCIGYRQTKPHIGWMLFENDASKYRCPNCQAQTIRFKLGAWSLTWRKRPAWKHGHWEHLRCYSRNRRLRKGECLSFPHPDITKVGLARRLRAFFRCWRMSAPPNPSTHDLSASRCFPAANHPQFRLKFRPGLADVRRVQPATGKKPLRIASAGAAGTTLRGPPANPRSGAEGFSDTNFFSETVSKITSMPIPSSPPALPSIPPCF